MCALLAGLCSAGCRAAAPDNGELLDTVRREAAARAGQPVELALETVNVSGDWAVLVGELRPPAGTELDWSKAADEACHDDLDKGLWVVAHRQDRRWAVEEMYVCAPEPPYWYLEENRDTAFSRPCGIYRGLQVTASQTAEDQCRAHAAGAAPAPPADAAR